MKKKTVVILLVVVVIASVLLGVVGARLLPGMTSSDSPVKNHASDKNRDDVTDYSGDKNYKKAPESAEFIGDDKAKEIALERAGLTEADKPRVHVELDSDDGRWEYEVEIKHNGYEYDCEINAKTGEIIKWESEKD